MLFLGELAALTTATCWASASILFTAAARRVGALTLNQARITGALLILGLLLLLTRGLQWAPQAEWTNVMILAVSGFIGLTLGDWAYFGAFVYVGPRLTTLLMTLAPPMTVLLGLPLLQESIGLVGVAGMSLTLAGVIWVVLEQTPAPLPPGHRIRGVVLGVLGSLGQALGLVLSKIGMGSVVDPLPATAIRMAAATVGIWAVVGLRGRTGNMKLLLQDPVARSTTAGATLLGPVIGVWMSLVAVRLTEAGIAATLMATTPILILPLVRLVYREQVSWRALGGAVVSVIGVAILFLR
jgi:drug/metabolite transporter (DMT)-like permease